MRMHIAHAAPVAAVAIAAALLAAPATARAAEAELLVAPFARQSVQVGLGGEFPGARGAMGYSNGVARLDFDFANGGHYVTMNVGRIAEGGRRLSGKFRCGCDADLSLLLRATDAKGDTYTTGTALRAAECWRDVVFDLSKLSHRWGPSTNAVDRATVKWPVTAEILAEPARRGLAGWVEARDVRLATEADAATQPDWTFSLQAPMGTASLFHGDETLSIPYALISLRTDGGEPAARLLRAEVTEAGGAVVGEIPIGGDAGALSLDAGVLCGRFGAFKATVFGSDAQNAPEREFASAWFARLVGRPKPVAWCGTGFHGWRGFERFRMMAAAGIGTARSDVYWPPWEKERGVYARPDDGFRESLDELHRLGIRLNAVLLGNSHPLYGRPLTEDMDCAWATPAAVKAGRRTFDDEAQAAFARWAAWFATHDGRDVDFYEIWNEAWNFYFGRFYSWSKKTGPSHGDKVWAREFAKFSRKVADAIREVRPDAAIGVCSEDGQDTSLIWMLEAGIAKKGDCVTFHPYTHKGDPRPDGNPFFFADEGRRMRNAMAANGGAERLRITEYGWSTFRPNEMGGHDFWFVGDFAAVTLLVQARYLVRAYLLARTFGVESMMQYDFQDDGPRNDYTEHNFGLTFQNLTPKPSFAAVAFMTWALGDAKPLGDFGSDPKTHRILGFEFPDGRRAYVAWAVEMPVEAAVPEYFAGKAFILRDLYGTPVKAAPDGALKLTEDPVYIH